MTLETCRGAEFYVIYIKIVYQVGINKGIELFYVEEKMKTFQRLKVK